MIQPFNYHPFIAIISRRLLFALNQILMNLQKPSCNPIVGTDNDVVSLETFQKVGSCHRTNNFPWNFVIYNPVGNLGIV